MSERRVVWLPITYGIEARPKGKQNPRQVSIREVVPLDVVEAGRDEVEVAARIEPTAEARSRWSSYHGSDANKPETPPHPHEVIVHGGSWYRPVMMPDGTPFPVEGFPDRVESFRDYPFRGGPGDVFGYSRPIDEVPATDLHEIRGDTREHNLEAARRVASTLLVVDGVLMRPTVEPIVEIRYRGQELRPSTITRKSESFNGIGVHVHADGLAWTEESGVLFRIDEWEKACGIATELASESNAHGGVRRFGAVESCDPDALSFQPHGYSLSRMREELDWIARTGFGPSPRAVVGAWCEAVDALTAYEAGEIEQEVLVEAIDALTAHDGRIGGFSGWKGVRLAKARLTTLPEMDDDPALDMRL